MHRQIDVFSVTHIQEICIFILKGEKGSSTRGGKWEVRRRRSFVARQRAVHLVTALYITHVRKMDASDNSAQVMGWGAESGGGAEPITITPLTQGCDIGCQVWKTAFKEPKEFGSAFS